MEQWYWSTRRSTMEVWPLNAARNTGVMPYCTYRKHGKVIQELEGGRASKDSYITTGHQHKTWILQCWQQLKVYMYLELLRNPECTLGCTHATNTLYCYSNEFLPFQIMLTHCLQHVSHMHHTTYILWGLVHFGRHLQVIVANNVSFLLLTPDQGIHTRLNMHATNYCHSNAFRPLHLIHLHHLSHACTLITQPTTHYRQCTL